MKRILSILLLMVTVMAVTPTVTSCSSKEEPSNNAAIVGEWVDGYTTLTFGKDGSYREDGFLGQYRIGTYSYNPAAARLVIDIKAIEGNNDAYQQVFTVQTLTSTQLVLVYSDGDVKGNFTKK